jgi:hypothetical protein
MIDFDPALRGPAALTAGRNLPRRCTGREPRLAYIRVVDEAQARDNVAADYAFISSSYSKILGPGTPTPTPQVYRTSSIVPAYFGFGAVQNRVLTNDGLHDVPEGPVPGILVMFAISMYSCCFY